MILTFAITVALFPIHTDAAKKLELNKQKLTLFVGKSYTLKLKNNKSKVKWSSSKAKIATVSSKGKVRAKRKGNCKITAKVGRKKYICNVTVKKNSPKENTSSPSTATAVPSAVPSPSPTPHIPSATAPAAITDDTFSGKIFAAYAWVLLEEYMVKNGYTNYTVTTISSATCTDSDYIDCIQIEGMVKNVHYYFIAGLKAGQPIIGPYFTSMTIKGVHSHYLSGFIFLGEKNYNLNGEFSTTGTIYDYYEMKSLKDQYKSEGNYQMH